MTDSYTYIKRPGFLTQEEIDELAAYAAAADAQRTSPWSPGKRGTGYESLQLDLSHYLPFSWALLTAEQTLCTICGITLPKRKTAHLVRYPVGASFPRHKDDVAIAHKDGIHFHHRRLNAIVIAPYAGGEFWIEDRRVALVEGDAVIFRPDDIYHEVTEVTAGERLVLSVGIWYQTRAERDDRPPPRAA